MLNLLQTNAELCIIRYSLEIAIRETTLILPYSQTYLEIQQVYYLILR